METVTASLGVGHAHLSWVWRRGRGLMMTDENLKQSTIFSIFLIHLRPIFRRESQQQQQQSSSSSPGNQSNKENDSPLPKYKRDLVQKMKILRQELQGMQPQAGHCRIEVSREEIFEVRHYCQLWHSHRQLSTLRRLSTLQFLVTFHDVMSASNTKLLCNIRLVLVQALQRHITFHCPASPQNFQQEFDVIIFIYRTFQCVVAVHDSRYCTKQLDM